MGGIFIKFLRISKNNWVIYTLILLIVLSIINEMLNHFVTNFLVSMFIVFPLMILLFIGGIVLLILSIIHIFKKYKITKMKSLLPLLLSLVLLFLIFERPFFPVFQKAEFSFKLDEREEVAGQILKGEIRSSNEQGDLYPVPQKYNHSSLSDGNEVMKMNDKLLFFTVRGILDNFSGYVFSPNGSAPTNDDVQADIIKIQKMSDHWYYISCT